MKRYSVSVFFPCYNDEKSIGRLITDTYGYLSNNVRDWEIVVVNDGSVDKSQDVLRRLARKIPHMRIIRHRTNKGYGAALRSGFSASKKEYVFYTDGDGQYDPKEIGVLLPLMTDDADFINGIKSVRKDPTYRVVLGNWYGFIVRWLFWLPICDVDCDFRLIRSSIIRRITLTKDSGAVCVELVKKSQLAGARFRQVSVHHYERRFGSSQFFRADRLLYTAKDIAVLWWDLMIRPLLFRRNVPNGGVK